MRMKGLLVGAVLAATAVTPALVSNAAAQDTIYVPLFTYRTGPFAGSGIPIANGMVDYLNMLNERDGGINGVKIVVEECETGYDTKKGVECYDSLRSRNPVVVNPYSTGMARPSVTSSSTVAMAASRSRFWSSSRSSTVSP